MKYCKICGKHRLSPNNKTGYCIWCVNPNQSKQYTQDKIKDKKKSE